MFMLVAIALMLLAGIALSYSVESSYYDSFKTRLEKGIKNWGLKQEPSKEEIVVVLEDLIGKYKD